MEDGRHLRPGVTQDAASLPAGDFSTWLHGMERALQGDAGSDVPCGGCTACCTSSQFVHIGPDERDTLSRVPKAVLFPAPGLPQGNVVMGYDERGHCPMFVDGACSIYEHRPRTCRTYDCRIFTATGIEPDDGDNDEKAAIARRTRQWRFDVAGDAAQMSSAAVRAAARYVAERRGDLPPEADVPATSTQAAVLAIRIHGAFLGSDGETGRTVVVDPEPEAVRVVLSRRRR